MSQEMRLETEAEHLARDIREGRFPNQSERKMVPAENDSGYLIWKQGAFYRPNSQGYTTSAIQAGRYSLADAISITHPNGPDGPRDGMGYVHESEVVDADWQAYFALLAEIATKDAEIARLTVQPSPDVAALVDALRSTLNFIENTEGEMGVILECGDKARAALARLKGGNA